ncbi:MAG: DUF6510 family protein [Chloroflexota bacterium]|nr:DUF6510 family protein [Chloroflexota bacterium]
MDEVTDISRELMLDGNAAAGLLYDAFGMEVTAAPAQCANCGNVGPIATLLAFTRAPGTTLRCSVCEQIVLRIVQTPGATYVDARGAVYLRLARQL